jgi:hypothetical protein
MRKKLSGQPKRRGAPKKSRHDYWLMNLKWVVFLRKYPSLTKEDAARKFLYQNRHWISGDLNFRTKGYGTLRNACRLSKKEFRQERRQHWHTAIVGLSGRQRLLTTPLQEAQEAYLLLGIGSDRSLANLSG